MTFGQYLPIKARKDYNQRKFNVIEGELCKYPTLKDSLNVEKIPLDSRIENFILNKLSRKARYDACLEELDKTLKLYISKLNIREKKKFLGELFNPSASVSSPKFFELNVFYELIHLFNEKNIVPEPNLSNGGKADFKLLNRTEKPIFFEVGEVGDGITKQKLKEVFNKCSKKLYPKLDKRFGCKLMVDSSKLCWDSKDGALNVPESIKVIEESFLKIGLHKLIKFIDESASFHFSSWPNLGEPNKKVKESTVLKYHGELGELLDKNRNSPKLSDILNTKIEFFSETPIEIVSFYKAQKGGVFEIESDYIFPSESALESRESFIKQMLRKIEQKIKDNQREDDHINILILKANHWTLSEFLLPKGIGSEEFKKIKGRIEQALENKKSKNLSGILLFHENLEKSRFIKNKYCEHQPPKNLFERA